MLKHQHVHKCRAFCIRCVLITIGFPVEHVIWERVPLVKLIPPILGIH